MEIFRSLAVAFFVALLPSLSCADVFLPISSTNTFLSADRVKMEQAIARAKASGKFVYIDMAAAWCGPCAELDEDFEKHAAELAPTLAHFEVVKLEQMHLESFFAVDFLPTEIPWYPSLFILNPQTEKWSFLYNFTALEIRDRLELYLKNGALTDELYSMLQKQYAAGQVSGIALVADTLMNVAMEKSASQAVSIALEIRKMVQQSPEKFNLETQTIQSLMNNPYLRLLESGKITWKELRALDPQALQEVDTTASVHHRVQFSALVGNTLRTKGNLAAAAQCDSLAQQADATIPTSTPAATAQLMKFRRQVGCALLKISAGTLPAPELQKVIAAIPADTQANLATEISQAYAATGANFDDAVKFAEIVRDSYLKKYAAYPALFERIKKAMEERIAALKAHKPHP